MRKNGFLLTTAMIAFALNACGGHVSAAPLSAEEIASGACTAIALTSMAQLEQTKTAFATPTATYTAVPTAQLTLLSPTISTPAANPPVQRFENSYPELQINVFATPTVAAIMQSGNVMDKSSTGATTPCDGSAYVDDVSVPDGTVFAPGEVFTKTWKLKNTGTCTWNKFYAITFSGGDDMFGATTTLRRAIPPNGTGNVSLELTAPGTEGTYTSYWVMTNGSGAPFGNVFYVQIVVKSDDSSEDE